MQIVQRCAEDRIWDSGCIRDMHIQLHNEGSAPQIELGFNSYRLNNRILETALLLQLDTSKLCSYFVVSKPNTYCTAVFHDMLTVTKHD